MGEDKKEENQQDKTLHVAAVGLLLLVIGVVLVFALSAWKVQPLIKGTLATGIDVFAVLYIDAQFIERLVEPFSEKSPLKKDTFGNTSKITDSKKQLTEAQGLAKAISDQLNQIQATHPNQDFKDLHKNDLTKDLATKKDQSDKAVNDLSKEVEGQSMRRVYSFWGLTSLMGMVLVYGTVGMFQTVGLPFQDITYSGVTWLSGHALDSILSGVIVGAGTKPLHDLIGTLEKSSTQGSGSSS